jgi:hypothetical protein
MRSSVRRRLRPSWIPAATLALWSLAIGCGTEAKLPTDARLESLFRGHEDDFRELAALAVADTLLVGAGYDPMLRRFSIYVHDTPQADRLLNDRDVSVSGRGAYKRLLDRAGLRHLARSADGTAVRFQVASNANARKGIVYSVAPLAPLRASLDGQDVEARRSWRPAYILLAPRWYLYVEPRPE